MRMTMRRLSRVAVVAIVVALFSAPAGLAQVALVWQTETVDATGHTGFNTSLALDSAGQPHIIYYDATNDDLRYAAFDGTAWQTETVDAEGDVGQYTSLALDNSGQPHISYMDFINRDLKYAAFDGTAWQTETVDAEGDVGQYTSLALDNSGQPHISYLDLSNGDLKYAAFDGVAWQIETVDAVGNVGAFTSLVLDGAGQPRISYSDRINSDLKYAAFDGSAWQIETVDAAGVVGWETSLALDSAGQPHITYADITNRDLKYATFDGSAWQIEVVDATGDIGRTPSLALNSADQPHISYADITNGDLKYAVFDGTAWQIEIVDAAGDVGRYTSLVLDSAGQPHISYQDTTETQSGDLKYASMQPANGPPTVEADGPYAGTEGNPITLLAMTNDPDEDPLTTTWSYTIDSADPGTTCTFGDAAEVDTTFTCTDDGAFTLTLEANDGINPPVSDTATVTIDNANPIITDTSAIPASTQATISVTASDPGTNDILSYAFDCNNDDTFEVDSGQSNSASCDFGNQEGSFTIGVQVSDDDGGVTTDMVKVTIATNLCANNYTGVLRYDEDCRDYETTVTIPGEQPVEVCASTHNGLLRSPVNGACAGHETTYVLPEDGPLNICVSNYTQIMRVVDDIEQCASHEFGRVIAATEVGEAPPPR